MGRGFPAARPATDSFYRGQDVAVVAAAKYRRGRSMYLSNIARHVHAGASTRHLPRERIMVDHLMEKVKEGKITLQLNSTLDEVLGDPAV